MSAEQMKVTFVRTVGKPDRFYVVRDPFRSFEALEDVRHRT